MENEAGIKKLSLYPFITFIFFIFVFSWELVFMYGVQLHWSGASFPEYNDGRQVQGTVKKFFNFSQKGNFNLKLVLVDGQTFYISGYAYDLCDRDSALQNIKSGSEVSMYVSDEKDRSFIMALSCEGIEYLNLEAAKKGKQEVYISGFLQAFSGMQFCSIAYLPLLVIVAIQTDMGLKKKGYYQNRRICVIGRFLLLVITALVLFQVSSGTYAGYQQASEARICFQAGETFWKESVAYHREAFSCYRKGMIWASATIIGLSFLHLVAETKYEMANMNVQ